MTKILIDAGPSEHGWHALESFLKCPQLYSYKYNLAVDFPPSDPLVKGSLVHVGLAHHYARKRALDSGGDPNQYYTPIEAMELVSAKPEWKGLGHKHLADCVAAVTAYQAYYGVEKFKVLHVEEQFEALIKGKYKFTARFDLVVEEPDGKVYVWDSKTSYKISSTTVERYTLSGQFLSMATFGHTLWQKNFGGVRINFVGMIPDKSGKYNFVRVTPDPAPAMLRRFPQIIEDAELGIRKLEASLRPFTEWPVVANEQVCMGPYGKCPAWDMCQFGYRK